MFQQELEMVEVALKRFLLRDPASESQPIVRSLRISSTGLRPLSGMPGTHKWTLGLSRPLEIIREIEEGARAVMAQNNNRATRRRRISGSKTGIEQGASTSVMNRKSY